MVVLHKEHGQKLNLRFRNFWYMDFPIQSKKKRSSRFAKIGNWVVSRQFLVEKMIL